MRFVLFVALLATIGCSRGSQMSQRDARQPTFLFTVEEVFYIKPPIDRVILVGIVEDGSVKVGDSLTVRCQSGDVAVVLDGIDTIKQGEIQQASLDFHATEFA